MYQDLNQDLNFENMVTAQDNSEDVMSKKITEFTFINEIQPQNISIKITKYVKSYFFGVGQYVIDIDIKKENGQSNTKRLS